MPINFKIERQILTSHKEIYHMIDYRSDTVTKPSKEMKDAMFSAEVGDDVFVEDPTVNELEGFAADLFGMEASLYCSSGTQTNQVAIFINASSLTLPMILSATLRLPTIPEMNLLLLSDASFKRSFDLE